MGYPHYILITGRIMVGLLQVSMAPAHDSAVLQEYGVRLNRPRLKRSADNMREIYQKGCSLQNAQLGDDRSTCVPPVLGC